MSASARLLAVECATKRASVALLVGDDVVASRSASSDRHHAESLLAEVDALLADAAVALTDVDAFALSVGPGAFTSLRIGLATVKGLAFGSERPVAPISTLAAIAHGAPAGHERVAAVLDARRGEVYAGEFDRTGGAPAPIGEEAVETAEQLVARLAPGTVLAGEFPSRLAEAVSSARREDLVLLDPPETAPRAIAVGRLGRLLLEAGQGVAARDLVPRYLRRAEAEEKRLAAAGSLDTPEKLQ